MNALTFKDIIRAANNMAHPSDEALEFELEAWSNQPRDSLAWSVQDALMEMARLPATTRRWLHLRTGSTRADAVTPTENESVQRAISKALKAPMLRGESRVSRAQTARLSLLAARQALDEGPVESKITYRNLCLAFATQACGLRGEAGNVARALTKYAKFGGDIAPTVALFAEAAAQLCKADSSLADVKRSFCLWNIAAPFMPQAPTARLRAIQKQLWETFREGPLQHVGEEPLRSLPAETPLLEKHTVISLRDRYPEPEDVPSIPEAVTQFTTQLLNAAQAPNKSDKGRKLMLSGPPGSGKSFLAYVVGRRAAEHGIPMLEIHCSDVLDKFQGGTLANLRAIFAELNSHGTAAQKPVLLFLDEAEQLLGTRTGDSREQGGIVTTLLHFLDTHPQVFVIAATNCAQLLDHAAQRSFDYTVEKGLSSATNLAKMMANSVPASTASERKAFAALAMGLSPRDIVFAMSKSEAAHRSDASIGQARALAHALVDAQLNRTRALNIRSMSVVDGIFWDMHITNFRGRAAAIPPGDHFSLMVSFRDSIWQLNVQDTESSLLPVRGPKAAYNWGMTSENLTFDTYQPPLARLLACVDDVGDLRVRLGLAISPETLIPTDKREPVTGLPRFTDP